jgi:hypothetical protein
LRFFAHSLCSRPSVRPTDLSRPVGPLRYKPCHPATPLYHTHLLTNVEANFSTGHKRLLSNPYPLANHDRLCRPSAHCDCRQFSAGPNLGSSSMTSVNCGVQRNRELAGSRVQGRY